MKDFIHYTKYKTIKHGFDERTMKIVNYSWRNAATGVIIIIYAAALGYGLFYEGDVLLFCIKSINCALAPGIAVFFVSFWYYQRSKKL